MTDEPETETLNSLFFEAIMKRSDSLDLLKQIAMDVRDYDAASDTWKAPDA